MVQDSQIAYNIRAQERVARRYEKEHGEIFNDVEQARLRESLVYAIEAVQTQNSSVTALDFGCGTGNLTRHLLELGLHVVSADIAHESLTLIEEKFGKTGRSDTMLIDGSDLAQIPDGTFDLTAEFAVLHHISDYITAVREMVRVTRPGGVIYLDHEHAGCHFTPSPELLEFRSLNDVEAGFFTRLVRFLNPGNFPHKLRDFVLVRFVHRNDPRYCLEGDIHIWPDDHIDWDHVRETVEQMGCRVVIDKDYLHFQAKYDPVVYERYRDRCADMHVLVARKGQ